MSDKKKKYEGSRPGLSAVSGIDRSKYSLQRQTLDAEKRMRQTGGSRSAAMAEMATRQRERQSARPAPRPQGKKGSFVPSGPPKRNPFRLDSARRPSAVAVRESRVRRGLKKAFPNRNRPQPKRSPREKVLKSRPKMRRA